MNRCIAMGKLIRKQDKEDKQSPKQRAMLVRRLRKRMMEVAKEQNADKGTVYGKATSTLEPGVCHRLFAHC